MFPSISCSMSRPSSKGEYELRDTAAPTLRADPHPQLWTNYRKIIYDACQTVMRMCRTYPNTLTIFSRLGWSTAEPSLGLWIPAGNL